MSSLVVGVMQARSTLVIRVSTPRPSSTFRRNDEYHSFIAGLQHSPPRALGPVGSAIRCVHLRYSDAAYPNGCYLSRRIAGWAAYVMAIHLTADRLGRSQVNTLDLGVNGCDQCGYGNPDRLRFGALQLPG